MKRQPRARSIGRRRHVLVGDSLLVTEPVTKTVPVTREEVPIERVPVDEDEGAEATERAEVSELEKK